MTHVHDWEMSGGGMIVCRDHDDSFVVMGNDEVLCRLNDREALLAVVRAVQELQKRPPLSDTYAATFERGEQLDRTLAALPEHLE